MQPTRTGGFALHGGARPAPWSNIAGDHPAERFNHVHLFQEDPFCAQLWYQQHLNAPPLAGPHRPHAADRGHLQGARAGPIAPVRRSNRGACSARHAAGVEFGDVALTWYVRQGDEPLVSARGQLYDHIALSVTDLDAWVAKLRDEGITFLDEPYQLGETRAVMIERAAKLELVEIKRRDADALYPSS